MSFSQRYGHAELILDKNGMSEQLQNRIFNAIINHVDSFHEAIGDNEKMLHNIYDRCFKSPLSDLIGHSNQGIIILMTRKFLEFEWYHVYDFIENTLTIDQLDGKSELIKNINAVLKEENSAYRLINGNIVEITSEEEILEIQKAIESGFEGVKIHISQAVNILSNRDKPDYRNVIKESISAVESICQIITNDKKATLAKALDRIEEKYKIHSALKEGFNKIYGYTSDSDGIRHGLTEKPKNLTLTDAKFMLIVCSAFVNYLIGKISDLGIKIEVWIKISLGDFTQIKKMVLMK